jgi:phage baseplate assembly protein W
MSVEVDFVGRGWAFPLQVGPRGGIAMMSGPEEIESAIRIILSTAPGERVMRPEFGCGIWDLLFAPVEPNVLGLMAQTVREAIARWEPRIELEEVQASPDPANPEVVSIGLTYSIKATNDRRNLVFPFYVIPGGELT